jgi:hypothetical protein
LLPLPKELTRKLETTLTPLEGVPIIRPDFCNITSNQRNRYISRYRKFFLDRKGR